MKRITSTSQIATLNDNYIIGEFEFINSEIIFAGKNNLLFYFPEISDNNAPCKLENMRICFHGDNSLCFLNAKKSGYSFTLDLFNNCFFHFGLNGHVGSNSSFCCSEQCNIFIGDKYLFSYNIKLETSDWHLIYDAKSNKRINPSKSIFIGDHVWLGHNANILKGTHIGSGSIVGANAVLAGKRVTSNSLWVGNPAKLIKSNVFYAGAPCTPSYIDDDIEYNDTFHSDDIFVYNYDENETINTYRLESEIQSFSTAKDKANFLLELNKRKSKNRFYIA